MAGASAAAPEIRANAKTSFSSDQSDLWWKPAESGWGMQIVQQADVLFATLFVYDIAGAPHWTAPDGTTCDYGGSFFQQGHVGQLAASYTCSTGERGNMAFAEMTNRVGMVSGQFQGHSDSTGCDRSGRFTGLTPN